jgi:hypothetical protein
MMPENQKFNDTIVPRLFEIFEAGGWRRDVHFYERKSPDRKIVLPIMNNHEIRLVTANNPKAISAVEYSHAFVDEAGDTPVEAVDRLEQRVRDKKSKCLQYLISGVPQGNLGWFPDRYDSESEEQAQDWERVGDFLYGWRHKKKSIIRVRLLTSWNARFLPSDYIENLKSKYEYEPKLLQAYLYGKFTNIHEGNAISTFNQDLHVRDEKPDPAYDLDLSFDFNALPLAFVVVQRKRGEDRKLYYSVSFSGANSHEHLDDAIKEFILNFSPAVFQHTTINIYGDRTGHARSHKVRGSDFEYIQRKLRSFGYHKVIIRASRGVVLEGDSIDCLNRTFFNNDIFIDRSCRTLIRSLFKTAWKSGLRKLDKPAGEDWTHWLDALKYYIFQNEIYDKLSNKKRTRGLII